MNIIKSLPALYYKLAWKYGLILIGTDEGLPLWFGSSIKLDLFFKDLETNNL